MCILSLSILYHLTRELIQTNIFSILMLYFHHDQTSEITDYNQYRYSMGDCFTSLYVEMKPCKCLYCNSSEIALLRYMYSRVSLKSMQWQV